MCCYVLCCLCWVCANPQGVNSGPINKDESHRVFITTHGEQQDILTFTLMRPSTAGAAALSVMGSIEATVVEDTLQVGSISVDSDEGTCKKPCP